MDGLGDGWMVWDTLGRLLVTSYRFSLNSASKLAISGKPTRCTRNLEDSLYFYRIQPREKRWLLEVMEGLGKVVDGWNGVRKCLASFSTQNQGQEMVVFAQHAWRNFYVK